MKSPIPFLRKIAIIEAISLVVLVGIAMPLKYIWHYPLAVKIVGMIHGLLFIVFCLSLAQTFFVAKWPLARAALVFAASIIPFATFVVDRRMPAYEAEFQNRTR